MTSNHQIASGQLIDLSTQVVGMARSTRRAVLVDQEPGQPPRRIDGPGGHARPLPSESAGSNNDGQGR